MSRFIKVRNPDELNKLIDSITKTRQDIRDEVENNAIADQTLVQQSKKTQKPIIEGLSQVKDTISNIFNPAVNIEKQTQRVLKRKNILTELLKKNDNNRLIKLLQQIKQVEKATGTKTAHIIRVISAIKTDTQFNQNEIIKGLESIDQKTMKLLSSKLEAQGLLSDIDKDDSDEDTFKVLSTDTNRSDQSQNRSDQGQKLSEYYDSSDEEKEKESENFFNTIINHDIPHVPINTKSAEVPYQTLDDVFEVSDEVKKIRNQIPQPRHIGGPVPAFLGEVFSDITSDESSQTNESEDIYSSGSIHSTNTNPNIIRPNIEAEPPLPQTANPDSLRTLLGNVQTQTYSSLMSYIYEQTEGEGNIISPQILSPDSFGESGNIISPQILSPDSPNAPIPMQHSSQRSSDIPRPFGYTSDSEVSIQSIDSDSTPINSPVMRRIEKDTQPIINTLGNTKIKGKEQAPLLITYQLPSQFGPPVGFGLNPTKPKKIHKMQPNGIWGDIHINPDHLKKLLLTVFHTKTGKRLAANQHIDYDLVHLLTKRHDPRKQYSQNSMELFNKLIKHAGIPITQTHSQKFKTIINNIEQKQDAGCVQCMNAGCVNCGTAKCMTHGSGMNKRINDETMIKVYSDPDEVASRLSVLVGEISAKNDNVAIKNEASQLADWLFKHEEITQENYKDILKCIGIN